MKSQFQNQLINIINDFPDKYKEGIRVDFDMAIDGFIFDFVIYNNSDIITGGVFDTGLSEYNRQNDLWKYFDHQVVFLFNGSVFLPLSNDQFTDSLHEETDFSFEDYSLIHFLSDYYGYSTHKVFYVSSFVLQDFANQFDLNLEDLIVSACLRAKEGKHLTKMMKSEINREKILKNIEIRMSSYFNSVLFDEISLNVDLNENLGLSGFKIPYANLEKYKFVQNLDRAILDLNNGLLLNKAF
jgi:hypothetical protein